MAQADAAARAKKKQHRQSCPPCTAQVWFGLVTNISPLLTFRIPAAGWRRRQRQSLRDKGQILQTQGGNLKVLFLTEFLSNNMISQLGGGVQLAWILPTAKIGAYALAQVLKLIGLHFSGRVGVSRNVIIYALLSSDVLSRIYRI